jgi:periodic tryptophan protein 2
MADTCSVLSGIVFPCSILLAHTLHTIDACTHRDIATMALSPNGALLLVIDVEGGGMFINMRKRVPLAPFHFKKPVSAVSFSPDSTIVAVSHGRHIQLWRCPPLITTFRPLTLLRTLTGHYDEVTTLQWSHDGKYILSGSEDMSVRLHRVWAEEAGAAKSEQKVGVAGESASAAAAAAEPMDTSSASVSGLKLRSTDLPPITLTGHRGAIVGAYFGQPKAHLTEAPIVYTVSKDGALFVWNWITEKKQRDQNEVKVKEEPAEEEEEEAEDDDEDEEGSSSESDDEEAEDGEGKEDGSDTEMTAVPTGKKKRKRSAGRKKKEKKTHVAKPLRGPNTALFNTRGRFKLIKKHFFEQNHAKVLCCAMHQAAQYDLLVVGFDSGVFGLYELPDFNMIHSLSISQKRITSVAVDKTGCWLAFGSAKLGQLLAGNGKVRVSF